ncbi:MAG: hypothetical protein HDT40_07725 [Lachnospiraceae bacterium]|nr:hypothetical protein [Lachnospiraceae bacterium]
MAKIDLAYSLEIDDVIDAMEANEMWIDGQVLDKKAFVCPDPTCDARITCKNMDTYADKRKMNPHFIMASRVNMHSADCQINKENKLNIQTKDYHISNDGNPIIGRKVCFHLERPQNHGIVNKVDASICENKEKERDKKRKKYVGRNIERKSNYYWLNSLVWFFVESNKGDRTKTDSVEIDFGKGRKYTYSLDNLFKRISEEKENTDKDRNHYIYYGKAKIQKRKDNSYSIAFLETFLDSSKIVKCIIHEQLISDCKYGKNNKLSLLNSAVGKERYVYVLSTKNASEKYNTVFLNIENLDSIAISEMEIGRDDYLDGEEMN